MEYKFNFAKAVSLAFVFFVCAACQHRDMRLVCVNGYLFNDTQLVGYCPGEEDLPFKPNGEPDFDLEYFNQLKDVE